MKRFLMASLLLPSIFAFSQKDFEGIPTAPKTSRWTYGGYAGVGGLFAGNSNVGGTSIYFTPRGGYKVTEDLEVGVAGNLSWNNSKNFTSTMVGVGPFANYYFSRTFYVAGMFQQYFVNQKYKPTSTKTSFNESALYLGAGYLQHLGSRTYLQMGGLYNVLYKENRSVFGGAFIPNVGIVMGL